MVGKNARAIEEYIRSYLAEDERMERMKMEEDVDLFADSKKTARHIKTGRLNGGLSVECGVKVRCPFRDEACDDLSRAGAKHHFQRWF